MVENRSRRAPTPICVQRPRGPTSLGPVTACPVAPSLSAFLADRAPARASTADPVYRRSKIGPIDRPCKASVWPDTQGPANGPRRRAIALRHSRRLCAAAGTLPPPLLDGRKSVLSTAHANMHAKHRCGRIPKVRQTARAAAPSRSGTLADCARPRGRSPDTKDCAIKKCSARLLTDPQERLPAKVEYALRAITWVLACVRLRVRHRSGLPVVHSVSGN